MLSYQAAAFEALGNPTRRAIFERLAERPRAVGELAEEMPVSRPAVSQHLGILKSAGLVTDRADGSSRIYQIDPSGLSALRGSLEALWNQALDSFRLAGEETNRRGR